MRYWERVAVLPLIIFLVEDRVNQLVNKVGDDVRTDYKQKSEQIVHCCHLLSDTSIGAVTVDILHYFKKFASQSSLTTILLIP